MGSPELYEVEQSPYTPCTITRVLSLHLPRIWEGDVKVKRRQELGSKENRKEELQTSEVL